MNSACPRPLQACGLAQEQLLFKVNSKNNFVALALLKHVDLL